MSSHKGKKKRIGSRRRVAHQNDTAEPEELPGTDRAPVAQWLIPEHSSDSPSLLLNPNHSQVDTQHPSSSEILEDNGGKGSSRQMEHAKDSATEQSHKLTEEVEENMGNETLKVTQSPPAMQDETVMKLSPTNEHDAAPMTQIYSASIPEVEFEKDVQQETRSDIIQIAADSVQVGENEHLFGTFQSSGLRSHPPVNEQVIDETMMPQKQHPLAANVEIGQLLDNKNLLWQDGVSQTNNLASEAHDNLRDMEPSATSKITNEKNSLGKNTEIENVKQAACFSPTVEQLKHLNFPEHSEEVSLHENKVALREVHEINDSFKQVEHAVKADADICFTNPMVPVAIRDREKSDPGVKGTEDPVPTQVVHPSDTQEKNVTNTDESQISSTKISDTAFGQVHEDEDQGKNYVKIGFEGYLGGVNEGEYLQTIPFEIESQNENREQTPISSMKVPNTALLQLHEGKDQDVVEVKLSAEGFISGAEKAGASFPFFESEINTTLESKGDDSLLKTEEETDNSFNPIRSRRKMGSSRRVKVSHHVKESDAGKFYDSPEDVAGNVRNNEPSATIEMTFAEGPVQEESVEPVQREMDKLDMPQTDQINESESVGISDFTSSQLLSDSPGHQIITDQSGSEEIPTEKNLTVCSVVENIDRDKDQDFFMECGHEQFLEEIPPSKEEEEHGENYSSSDEKELEIAGDADSYLHDQEVKGSHIHESEHSKSNVHDVTESLEPSSGNRVVQSKISDTNESVVSVKSTSDSATTKDNNMEVMDQRDENASHTEESQKGSPEISGSASHEVHGDENQTMDGVKYNVEGLLGRDEETGSSLQTIPFKTDAPSKSQNEENLLSTEEKESSFNPMKSRRKMGSSRRHKGRGPAKESGTDTFHESSEDTAENISDQNPLETTERSSAIETGVPTDSTEPMLKGMDTLVLEQVQENIPVGIEDFPASNLLSVSPENKDEKEFPKQTENWQFVEEIALSSQKGEEQSEPFNLLEVTDLQSLHDSDNNVPDNWDIQVTNASELTLKSINDSVTQREALSPDVKQEEHPTKEINMKLSDHTDGNASNTVESQISHTMRPDTTVLFQVHEGEDQDVKLGAEGFISGVEEAKSPFQTIAPEINAPLESQSERNPLSTGEETENSFSPMKSRRKMGSSRRHKGRGPAKESDADIFHESSEDVAENISDKDLSKTTFATETTILKEPAKTVIEGMKSINDSVTQREALSPDVKQEEHPTKEINVKSSDHTDGNASVTGESSPISNTVRPDTTPLFLVHEGEDQDVKLGAEGFISEVEVSKSPLQSNASKINAPLEAQSESNPLSTEEETENSFNPMKSRRKMGSSRRHKGRGPAKESDADTFHESSEDIAENISDKDLSETTERSFATESTIMKEPVKTVMEDMDKLDISQTEGVNDQIKGNSDKDPMETKEKFFQIEETMQKESVETGMKDMEKLAITQTDGDIDLIKESTVSISEFTSSNLMPLSEGDARTLVQSDSKETTNQEILSVSSDTDIENQNDFFTQRQPEKSFTSETAVNEAQTERVQDQVKEDVPAGTSSLSLLSISPKSKDENDVSKQHGNLQFVEETVFSSQKEEQSKPLNLLEVRDLELLHESDNSAQDHSDICDTNAPELIVKSIDDSATQEYVLNLDDKQQKQNPKEKIMGGLDQTDESQSNGEETPIGKTDTSSSQAREGEDRDAVDVKSRAGGFISGFEQAEASLPTSASEINVTEVQSEDSPFKTEEGIDNSLNPMRSRRKMGSSRRHKGSQHAKESITEPLHESVQAVAGNITDEVPSAATGGSFAIETAVLDESLKDVQEMDESDTCQTDQVKESASVGMSEFTSSNLVPVSPIHQVIMDISGSEQVQNENNFTVCPVTESTEREEDQELFMECGHGQFLQELSSSNEGEEHDENVILSEGEELEITGDDSDLHDQHKVLNTNEKQVEHPMKDSTMEALDKRDGNASNREKSLISNTGITDNAMFQVHDGKDQKMNDVKCNVEGFFGEGEDTKSSMQTLPFEMDDLSKSHEDGPLSTEEEKETFNPMKSRRKMGSSRRHKGRGPAKESGADTFHESSEDTSENISDKDPLETPEGLFTTETGVQGESAEPMLKEISSLNLLSVSPENKDVKDLSKHPEKWQFVEEITFSSQKGEEQSEPFDSLDITDLLSPHDSDNNVPNNSDIKDANASELKSINDSVTQREALSPDIKQEEHPTKEINTKVSDHTDGNASNTEESQISNTVRPDTTVLFQVHEGEDQDVKLGAEGFVSGVEEAKSPLQTIAPEINAPLEAQSERNPLSTGEETENSFSPMKSRRKMGSSRRHKGRGPAKESGTDTFHESSEDTAENISDQNPLETTERSFAIETGVPTDSTEPMLKEMDTLVLKQVQENIPDGIEDFPASNLLSVSPENKDEKEFPKQTENWQFVEEITLSSQKGEEQSEPFNLLEVTDLQSLHDSDNNVPDNWDIQGTNASELTLKSINDSVTQREALSPDVKQEEHPTKEINMKLSEHTDGNASNTVESQISNTVRPDTTVLFQVHEGEDQDVKLGAEGFISGFEEAKSPLQMIAPEINDPLESQSERNPLSTGEETENSFSPMKSRRKMGSSRRHKGRGPAKESGADTFHESSEDVAENISDQNPLETTERSFVIETGVPTDSTEPMLKEMDTLVLKQVQENIPVGIEDFPASNLLSVSSENKDEKEFPKQTENWQFVEEITLSSQKGEEQSEPFNLLEVTDLQSPHDSDNNVPDNWDIQGTNASELTLKSINDSVTQREALSPDVKQEEHPTKEINTKVSDHTDGNASNTEESQISHTVRPDTTVLFQVHEGEDQDVKLGAEGFISGVEEAKSPFQTIAPEINAPLESQSERNPLSTGEETENSFSPMKSRRKMGSSRRHKGRGPAKESDADIFHESSEDVPENISDKDLSKTFATETTILKEPAKTFMEDMDKWDITQTEGVNDQIKGTTPVSISAFTSSDLTALSEGDPWILVQSDSREMPNEPLSDYTAKDSENKERYEDGNLPRHTQDDFKYLVSQSLMKAEGVVVANTPERTTEIEYNVEKENMSSPNGKQSAKGEDDEHFKLSTVKDAQPSEGDLNNVYQQEIKPMEVRGADPPGSSSPEERTPSQTSLPGQQSPLDSEPQGNPGLHKLRGNKRKLGSSRRIKGSRVAAESPNEPDVANNATSEEVCDTVPFDKMPTETTETDISSAAKDENKELMQVEDTILSLSVGVNASSPGNDDSLKPKEEGIRMEPDILSHLTGHDTLKLELKEDSAWKGDSDLPSTSYGGDKMGLETSALDLGQNKEAREKELYTMAESGEESKEKELGDDTGVLNLLVSDQKDIGVKREDSPDEPFSASQIKSETLLLLDVGTEENKMEPVTDSPVDGESPKAAGPQKKDPTQKKRKLGSTRRSQLNRKPEESIDNSDTKQIDFDADVQHFGTQGEVEEAQQIVSAEVLQNQKAEPPLTTEHEVSTDQDLQRKPSSSAPDLISSTENVMSFLSEKPSSIVEEVNRFFQAPDLDDAERHRSGDTLEKQTRQEDINVAQGRDNLEVAAQENKYISEEGDDTEMKSESPNLTNRRRKMGSTRKSLRAARDEEDLHQQQGVKNEATDAVTNSDVLPATVSGIEEEEALKAKDQSIGSERRGEKAEQRPGESPALGQQVEAEHHLVPLSDPLQADESPGLDAMSESTHGRRRRKMGSHRKSHGQDTPTETEPWRSLKTIMDESLLENPQGQCGPDNTSQVEEGSKNSLLNITPSETGELSALVTRNKAPQRVAASRNPAVNPSQGHISLADSSTENSYNVVMVGDSGVGKTSFMKRAQSGKFSLDIPSSIGLDTCLWTVLVDGKPVVLQLWDTAGQERFHSITKQVFHRAQAFLLMYDISSSQTFSAIRYWAECIQEGAVENAPILLVGNKSDHEKRQVTPEAGETLAKEYNFDFMECSAATGDNVVQSLETIARLLTQRAARREEPLVFLKDTQQKKESGCC